MATQWELDTAFGKIPIFERFHIVDGLIKEAIGYFDPPPITNPQGA